MAARHRLALWDGCRVVAHDTTAGRICADSGRLDMSIEGSEWVVLVCHLCVQKGGPSFGFSLI